MKTRPVILLSLLLLCLSITGCSSTAEVEAGLASALQDYYADRNAEGLGTLEDVLVLEADNGDALALREAFYTRDDQLASLETLELALEANPESAIAYTVRGGYNYDANFYSDALADLNKAIELDPELAMAYGYRSLVHSAQGDYQAEMADLNKTLELEPGYIAMLYNRGGIHFFSGSATEAMIDFSTIIELKPDEVAAYSWRAYINETIGELDAAIADYTRVIELEPTAENYYFRGYSYNTLKAYDKALADYSKALELDPDFVDALNGRAWLIVRQGGDLDVALQDALHAVELEPDDPNKADTLGWIYYELGDYDEALAAFSRALEAGDPFPYYGRGTVYDALDESDKALEDYYLFLESEYVNIDFFAEDVALVRERIAALGGAAP